MQVHCNEGVAIHIEPESCTGSREPDMLPDLTAALWIGQMRMPRLKAWMKLGNMGSHTKSCK